MLRSASITDWRSVSGPLGPPAAASAAIEVNRRALLARADGPAVRHVASSEPESATPSTSKVDQYNRLFGPGGSEPAAANLIGLPVLRPAARTAALHKGRYESIL